MNVLVTGASSGIGESVTRALVEAGHKVVMMARREVLLTTIAAELNAAHPGHVLVAIGDVAQVADCERAVRAGLENFGHLDALVNGAGTWVEKAFIDADYDEIRGFIDTDVTGAIQISRAVLPALKQRQGRMVHINGLQGLVRQRPPVLYAAVESAVRGLCESLRWEVGSEGVHVGLVTLGSVANTQAYEPDPAILSSDRQRISLSRREVVEAILFMLERPCGVNVDELVLTPLSQKW
jgi:NADP-dependent 3-hydroxy acid dehydrogenase YdfG